MSSWLSLHALVTPHTLKRRHCDEPLHNEALQPLDDAPSRGVGYVSQLQSGGIAASALTMRARVASVGQTVDAWPHPGMGSTTA